MRTVIASCLLLAVFAFTPLLPTTSQAQVVVLSDQLKTPATLTSTTPPFESVILPVGTTIAPPLSDPLPSFLSPVLFNFGLLFGLGF